MSCIFHIPHASKIIPEKYLEYFVLSSEKLDEELLKMSDHFTDELFDVATVQKRTIKFPVSRLLVDPERFESDEDEVMSSVGMGCIYEKTHSGEALKQASMIRDELISRYYRPHHEKLTNLVYECIQSDSKCLIIDCHSFPKRPLPYELHQDVERSEICIGTDHFHTPNKLTDALVDGFENQGFSVSVNKPFSGSIVPMQFYQRDKRVQTVMIEIRRDLYMNEESGEKLVGFDAVKSKISNVISNLAQHDYL